MSVCPDDWRLSDSDAVSTDGGQVDATRRRRPGRPVGSLTGCRSARRARDRLLANVEIQPEEVCVTTDTVATGNRCESGLSKLLRPIGAYVHRVVAKFWKSGSENPTPSVQRFVDQVDNPLMLTSTYATEAAALEMSRKTLKRKILHYASSVYFGSRLYTSGFFTWMFGLHLQKKVKLVASFRWIVHDETPLPMKAASGVERLKVGNVAHICNDVSEEVDFFDRTSLGRNRRGKRESVCKLVQVEVATALLVEDVATGDSILNIIPVNVPLQCIDRNIAENLKPLTEEHCDLPYFNVVRSASGFNMDGCTCDRVGANDRAENAIHSEQPQIPRLRLPCVAHMASTAQGKSFKPLKHILSGLTHMSLAQKPYNVDQLFFDSLFAVLKESCRPRDAPRPGLGSSRIAYRDEVLALCLPQDAINRDARVLELKMLLTGDLTTDEIDWHVPGVLEPDVCDWAGRVARALYPTAIETFPNHRWVSSLTFLAEHAVLAVTHNLLHRVGTLWLARLQSTCPDTTALPAQKLALEDWVLSESDGEQEENEEQPQHHAEPAVSQTR